MARHETIGTWPELGAPKELFQRVSAQAGLAWLRDWITGKHWTPRTRNGVPDP